MKFRFDHEQHSKWKKMRKEQFPLNVIFLNANNKRSKNQNEQSVPVSTCPIFRP